MSKKVPPPQLRLSQRLDDPDYAHKALQSVYALRDASDPCALLQRFRAACFALGPHCGLYIQAVPDQPDRWQHHALLCCDPRLAKAIRNCRTLQLHRWVRLASAQVDPLLLSELSAAEVHTDSGPLLLSEHGFRSGVLVPTHCGSGSTRFGLLCLGSSFAHDFESEAAHPALLLAQAMGTELNRWWLAYTRRTLKATARIRNADLELLAMERNGLGTKEIARATDSSCASVDSRFQRINVKMGCANRKASAARAAAHGLL